MVVTATVTTGATGSDRNGVPTISGRSPLSTDRARLSALGLRSTGVHFGGANLAWRRREREQRGKMGNWQGRMVSRAGPELAFIISVAGRPY